VGVDGVQRDRQLPGDLGPGEVGRQVAQHAQLASAELFGRSGSGGVAGGAAVDGVEDVGDQRGVRRPLRRQGRQQMPRAGNCERQDQPVRFGQVQRLLDGCPRRALVAPDNGKIKRFDCYPSGTVILAQLGVLGALDAAVRPGA
jgi:hypothetical protein